MTAGNGARVDGRVRLGSVELEAPVMTASGTAGYGTELGAYFDLSRLGAVVTKSLAPYPWPGKPAPRLHPTPVGMLNAVGLQGPGVEAWREHTLSELRSTGAKVVASIWGQSVDDYRRAAEQLSTAGPEVIAVEVNLSCPNHQGRHAIFAHDPQLSAEAIEATAACGRPRWAKLSANTDRLVDVAGAVVEAGAEAVTCINTLLGLAYSPTTLRPTLGAGGGGLSGPAIRPVAVRAVHEVRRTHPDLPIIGVGGVRTGWDAAEMLLAGADAVQVGTATFADPRAPLNVLEELLDWCAAAGCGRVAEVGALR